MDERKKTTKAGNRDIVKQDAPAVRAEVLSAGDRARRRQTRAAASGAGEVVEEVRVSEIRGHGAIKPRVPRFNQRKVVEE